MERTRRSVLGALGTAAVGGLAGCSFGAGDVPDGDIEAHNNYFDPNEYTVSVGETVTWAFAAGSHNVSAKPSDDGQVSIPDGAEPFVSYDGDNAMQSTNEQGTTFEHTFEVPGEYTYVCVPHASTGMVGTITVEEGTAADGSPTVDGTAATETTDG